MNKKIGRNDPCPCGSGKKYKVCCLKKDSQPKKLKAAWINPPKQMMPNLIERTFSDQISQSGEEFKGPEEQ